MAVMSCFNVHPILMTSGQAKTERVLVLSSYGFSSKNYWSIAMPSWWVSSQPRIQPMFFPTAFKHWAPPGSFSRAESTKLELEKRFYFFEKFAFIYLTHLFLNKAFFGISPYAFVTGDPWVKEKLIPLRNQSLVKEQAICKHIISRI